MRLSWTWRSYYKKNLINTENSNGQIISWRADGQDYSRHLWGLLLLLEAIKLEKSWSECPRRHFEHISDITHKPAPGKRASEATWPLADVGALTELLARHTDKHRLAPWKAQRNVSRCIIFRKAPRLHVISAPTLSWAHPHSSQTHMHHSVT